MKKTKALLSIFIVSLLVMGLAAIPASAAKLKGEEFNLIDETTGYTIIVPGFVDVAEYELERYDDIYDVEVIVMDTPKKDASGKYPIFEVVTDFADAYTLRAIPEGFLTGELGVYETKFSNKSAIFSPDYFNKTGFDKIDKDDIYVFDFQVLNKNNDVIFAVYDLNFVFVDPVPVVKDKTANPTSAKVVIDGKQVAFDAYSIDGNNYFKLRDLAAAINGSSKQFDVTWDSKNNAIGLVSGSAYTKVGNELTTSSNTKAKKAAPTKSAIYLDGVELELVAYKIDGNNYFKLRDIAEAIDFGVDWDAKLRTIAIDTKKGYTAE